MTWNYRVVKYADGNGYGVHEVYYNNGRESAMTKNPITFAADSVEEIRSMLTMAKDDVMNRPVFEEPKEWASK